MKLYEFILFIYQKCCIILIPFQDFNIQPLESQLKTSYMQGYPQEQPVYHGQVAHQQPVHHDQVVHPPNTQINPQQNALVARNQYLQNKVIELQTLLRIQNVQTDQTFHLERDLD